MTTTSPRPGSLRQLGAVLAALLLVVACAGPSDPSSPPPSDPDGSAEPTEPGGPTEPPPTDDADPDDGAAGGDPADDDDDATGHAPAPRPPGPVVLSEDETLPNGKQLASEIVQALTTYDPGVDADEVAARVAEGELRDDVAAAIVPIVHPDAWSRGEIVYPQLGGATAQESSVMVVVAQTIGTADGGVRTEVRTLDIRLEVVDGAWQLVEVASAGGEPVPRPETLSPAAEAVLDDPRIALPDSARWDIHAGHVADSLLELMTAMAEREPYGVVVLETGHPFNVFGTDRISRHMAGLAVDIYRLGDRDVIDDRDEDGQTRAFVEWLYDRDDVRSVGSPWALDGFGGRSFTDLVHQDHLHVESVPTPDEREAARARGALRSPGDLVPDPR